MPLREPSASTTLSSGLWFIEVWHQPVLTPLLAPGGISKGDSPAWPIFDRLIWALDVSKNSFPTQAVFHWPKGEGRLAQITSRLFYPDSDHLLSPIYVYL
jgi:hypothetical protein